MGMTSLKDTPVWTEMDPVKKTIVEELLERSKGKHLNESSGVIMAAIMKLREKKMSFTPEETDVLMNELTRDMTQKEIAKVDMMKQMIKNM